MKRIDEGIKHNNFKIRTELNKEWLDKNSVRFAKNR